MHIGQMSRNKWTYILGIFREVEIHVSKESGGLTKIKRGSFKKKLGSLHIR
jgi:hypothetical protein